MPHRSTVDKVGFAQRLKEQRVARELTIIRASELIGVSRKTYATWENPVATELPSDINYLLKIRSVLGISIDKLLMGGAAASAPGGTGRDILTVIKERSEDNDEFKYAIRLLSEMPDDVIARLTELHDAFREYASRPW